MKKLLLLLTFSFLLLISSHAQEYGWVDISGNISGNPFFTDVHAIGDEVWLTSITSDIHYSADGGATFTTQSVGTSGNSIFMKSRTDGYVAGVDGRVYRTTDGSSWNVLGGTLLNQIHSISFPLSGDGYCCGNNGWVGTVDSTGITGTEQLAVSSLSSISCPTNPDEAWVCGGSGVLMHYTGSSWNSIIIGGAASLSSVYFVPNTTEGWVVGDYGLINHSSNGTSFSPQTNPDTLLLTLNDVFSLDGQHAWIVGDGGRILHTTNGGSTWVLEAEGMTNQSFQAVFFTSPTNGYAAGTNKTLLKYTQISGMGDELHNKLDFEIFPNPARDEFKVQSIKFKVSQTTLEIYDLNGKKLLEKQIPKGSEEITVDVNRLQSGVYFCRVTVDNKSVTKKLIIK